MARVKVKGVSDVSLMLGKLAQAGSGVAKMVVYDGARVMADEISRQIRNLKTDEPRCLRDGDKFRVITAIDQRDLARHLGISRITKSTTGTTAVIGAAGYGSYKTKKYPDGLPMAMLARSLHKGTVVREKSAYIDRAIGAAGQKARAAMAETGEKAIAKIYAE